MYNFTVGTAHTYFVGDEQWLVHNCTTAGGRRIDPDHIEKIFDQRGFADWELDNIIDNSDLYYEQIDGASIHLIDKGNGYFDAVITGTGDDNFIVTALRNVSQRDIDKKLSSGVWSD